MNSTDLTFTTPELLEISVETEASDVSDSERQVFEIINELSLGAVVAVFGIVANVVNLHIFARQGFSSTVNIVLFGLSVSDLLCMICVLWFGICKNPLAIEAFHFGQGLCYLTAGWNRAYFARVTGCITAYAAAERCVCIAFPLKYRRLLSPAKTLLVVMVIYLANLPINVPLIIMADIGWMFVPSLNKSVIDLHVTVEWKFVDDTEYIADAILTMLIFVSVIVFTVVLVVSLRRTSRWRKAATLGQGRSSNVSGRDTKITKLISLIAALLIVSNAPGVVIGVITFVVPEFSVGGKYSNYQLVSWTFVNLIESANSGFTIFIYYTMSSKYRSHFDQIFCHSKVRVLHSEECCGN